MQIRKPEPTVTAEEVKKLREETPMNEAPEFNFTTTYEDLDTETLRKFAQKCKYIEDEALKAIAKKHHVNYSEIAGAVYIDIEDEWEATEAQVSDEDWINATVQNFETELNQEGYI